MTASTKRAVIYTRSARLADDTATARQEEACRRWAEEHGMPIVGIYKDFGPLPKEGLPPGLTNARDAFQRGEADCVIAMRPDRLGRTPERFTLARDALAGAGAAIHYSELPADWTETELRVAAHLNNS